MVCRGLPVWQPKYRVCRGLPVWQPKYRVSSGIPENPAAPTEIWKKPIFRVKFRRTRIGKSEISVKVKNELCAPLAITEAEKADFRGTLSCAGPVAPGKKRPFSLGLHPEQKKP